MRSMYKSTLIRNALWLGATGATVLAFAQAGCSSEGASGASQSSSSENNAAADDTTGVVHMGLTLPGGEQINTVTWTVTGPNGASTVVQTGSVMVNNSTTIGFLVGGLPAAAGYTITLSSTSQDNTVTCSGSATFSTAARTTTNVNVALQCTAAGSDSGSAQITATTYDCATWTSTSASPTETTVGNAVSVVASATGPNPGALTYAWSAPSGSFDNANSPAPHFTCTAPGPVTLTLNVSDGAVPPGGACPASGMTTTLQVTCDGHVDQAAKIQTATKIKHLIVIFDENISFDHYFGTYPNAQNNAGETAFVAQPGTPVPNNLQSPLDPTNHFAPITGINLLTNNPNLNPANGTGATNPFRLGAAQAVTPSQGHNYNPEQLADDNGAMDLFPLKTGNAGPPPSSPPVADTKGVVMSYFDGNALGTIWSLAQQYAMSDNSWSTQFGPSTPGAINLISGQTNGFLATNKPVAQFSASHAVADGNGGTTLIGDTDPLGDVCSTAPDQNSMLGKNVGDLLNAANVSWGFFEGGFDLTVTNSNGTTGCQRSSLATAPSGGTTADYIPHHQPFQYYPSTANLTHARPSSVAAIGKSVETDGVTPEPANHQYDSHDFFDALNAGNLPAVVYLKAPAFQDGHPGYSNPTDEQNWVANVVSALQSAQEWSSTAIVLAYDDSDGWYDHQMPPIVNPSQSTADGINGAGKCLTGAQQNGAAPATPLLGAPPPDGGAPLPAQGRCGYGTRQPLLVISPFAKKNFIDHTLTDQTSILRFVEDNWLNGQRIQPGGSFDWIANPITNMLTGITPP